MKKIYLLGLIMMLNAFSYAQYCTTGVGPSSTFDTNVEAVVLNGETLNINYTACPGVAGVEDQTGQVADLIAGSSYTVDVTWGTCGGNFSNDCEVWIDFDGSQSFEPGESIGTLSWFGGTGNLQSYGFTVPALALNGTHRMRVMSWEGGALPLDPCGSFTYGSVTDFSITISGGSTCGPATALNTSNVLTTSADLNWTPDGGAVDHTVEWGFPGFTPGTGGEEGSATGVVGGTTNATGLIPATTYEFYVQTDCGGSQSAWAGPYTFSTSGSCGFFEVSLFDTFGDGWNGGTVDVYINGVLFQSGLTVATGSGPVVYQIPVNTGDIISLDYTSGSFSTENEITVFDQSASVVATEGVGGTTPNDIGDYTIPTGLVACPACPAPSNIVASNITTTSVDLTWTENGTATEWDIEYGPVGFTPGTGTSFNTTNNPETIPGLSDATAYEFYVRAICGPGDTSIYDNSVTVVTPLGALNCTTGNPSIIYSQDFEGAFPTDWSQVNTADPDWTYNTGGTGSSNTGPSAAHNGTGYVYLETSSGATGDNDTLIGPPVDLSSVVGNARVSWYYHMYGGDIGTMELYASSDNVNWTLVWTQTGQTQQDELDAWNPAQADLSAYVGGLVYLRYVGSKGTGGSGFAGDMAIDLVNVEGCVSCPGPTNLTASNITGSTVDLTWTENGSATEWEIEYGPVGFTPGTGTSMITTNNPETVSGLTSITEYDFYVRAVCAPGDTSNYHGPVTIMTEIADLSCVTGSHFNLYTQDFEGGLPSDWSTLNTTGFQWEYNTGTTGSTGTGPSGAHSGTGYMYTEATSGSNGDVDYLTGPTIDLTSVVDAARATWYYHMFGATMDKLSYEVSTDGGTLWTEVWSDSGQIQTAEADPWIPAEVDLTAYAGMMIQTRFVGQRGSSFTGDMAVDIFNVDVCLTCPPVANLDTANVTSTTADISWTSNGTETDWIIEYGPAGFTPGTGTMVATTNNPETVTGLIDNTNYDFYVYADCGGGDTSMVTGPINFDTDIVCPAPTGLAFTYTSNDTMAFSWTAGGTETDWIISYGTSGFTPGMGTQINTSQNPDTITGIGPGVWDVYVQADCGGGVNNPWVGPITYIAPIPNDLACNAIPVPVDGTTASYANIGATINGGESLNGFNSVWFEFVAPASGHVEIKTCGNDFDNMLGVFEFTDCNAYNSFVLVDEALSNPFTMCSGVGTPAGINLCGLTPGNTYYLAIGSEVDGVTGIFPLTLTELPAINAGTASPMDVCEDDNAVDLFSAITGNLTTTGQWYENAAASGNEVASTVDAMNMTTGTNTFVYVQSEVCGADTSSTSINVVELPAVGVGSTLNAGCNFGPVNLFDGLSGNVDLGGTWFDSSDNPVGGTLINFNGEPAGSYGYYYVVDNGVCAADTSNVTVDVIDCASIGENALDVEVYPNPVKDVVFVKLANSDNDLTVQLLDLSGQMVTVPINLMSNVASINVAGLASGIYFVKVSDGDQIQNVRIVKQ